VSPAPEGYVDVSERIQKFYERYPEGSLQQFSEPVLMHVGERTFVCYTAAAYRNPDDPRPGIGTAWEPVPGPTPFTKDSELMNAETSAWGRAIAALGFEVRQGIASQQEVSARTGASSNGGGKRSGAQNRKVFALIKDLETLHAKPWPPHADWKSAIEARCSELWNHSLGTITKSEASTLIEDMTAYVKQLTENPPEAESGFQAPEGAESTLAYEDDDIPF